MRILILTHSYPDANQKFRGIFVREQVQALGAEHEIILVYFKVDYSHTAPFAKYTFKKRVNQNITEYELTTSKSFPVINQLKYLLNTYSFIKKEILAKQKIDIIHTHLSYPAGILGTFISERKKIPVLITEHTSIIKYYRSFVHKLCVKYALKHSSSVVCVSRALREEVLKIVKRPVTVIPNVIDTDKFSFASPNSSHINIGFLGSLGTPNKGLDLLLEAIAMINNANIRLRIGGKGILFDDYVNMADRLGIKNICIFYGEIKPEKSHEFYNRLNFFVLPSRYETFGIVLVEAMASGLPVISTRCGGPEDIVTDRTGILVSKDNDRELSLALEKMISQISAYSKEEIRKYAVENFGKDIFVSRMTKLYQEIINQWQERKHTQRM